MNLSKGTTLLDGCSFRLTDNGMPEWEPSFLTSEMSALLISLTIINLLVCPCTIFLNILVMMAVKTNSRLRNKYNALLACLAGTDLITGVLGQPVFTANQIYRLTGASSFASDFCGLRFVTSGTPAIASMQHLMLISIERYIAIKCTYKYHAIITKRRLVGAVLTAWSLAIFPSLYSMFFNSSSVFFTIFRVFTILSSICVLIFCHIAVYHEARKQMLKIKTQQVSAEAKETFLKENKALKTSSFVIGAALVTFLPLTFFRAVLTSRISSTVGLFALEAVLESLALFNSVCNPLIYCARSREYRAAFKKLLGLKENVVEPALDSALELI